jgi:hypothetical protein
MSPKQVYVINIGKSVETIETVPTRDGCLHYSTVAIANLAKASQFICVPDRQPGTVSPCLIALVLLKKTGERISLKYKYLL